MKMDDGKDRWIAFDYDDHNRIARAHDSNHREVRYDYDDRGRLSRVAGSDGKVRRYMYTDADELATIEEPGASIENAYENGRCVRQVNRFDRPRALHLRLHLHPRRWQDRADRHERVRRHLVAVHVGRRARPEL